MIPPLALPRQRGAVMFTAKLGALAQLGERLHGMQEVRGSIPLGSTITHKNPILLNILVYMGHSSNIWAI